LTKWIFLQPIVAEDCKNRTGKNRILGTIIIQGLSKPEKSLFDSLSKDIKIFLLEKSLMYTLSLIGR